MLATSRVLAGLCAGYHVHVPRVRRNVPRRRRLLANQPPIPRKAIRKPPPFDCSDRLPPDLPPLKAQYPVIPPRAAALPTAQIDGPAFDDFFAVHEVDALVKRHRWIDVRRNQWDLLPDADVSF